MGCEFGQGPEWDHEKSLDWYTLEYPLHLGLKQLVSELNQLYKNEPALYQYEFDGKGFDWIDCQDTQQSALTFLRKADDQHLVIALNFTPIVRNHYRVAVPTPGKYKQLINSDAKQYGGSGITSDALITAESIPWQSMQYSIIIQLPPLAGIILQCVSEQKKK